MSDTQTKPPRTLHHVIAREKTQKTETSNAITNAYHLIQKPALFNGLSKTYLPKDAEGETLPSDLQRIQVHAPSLIKGVESQLVTLFDLTAQKDWANCRAKADVVVDGKVLLSEVPATYLLFLEKQLVDIHTFIKKLPTCDPAEQWTWDTSQGHYVSGEKHTNRTKKIMRNHVLAEATKEHPAQVQPYSEDASIGTYKQVNFTGALPVPRVEQLLERVDALRVAVKEARETANTTPIEDIHAGKKIFDYLLAE
jgi:hypothetical protein